MFDNVMFSKSLIFSCLDHLALFFRNQYCLRYLFVISVFSSIPGELTSQIGDRILKINGNPTDHLHHQDASQLLRQLNGPITFHVFTPNAERHSLSDIRKDVTSRSSEYLDRVGNYPGNLIGYQTGSVSSLAMSQMSTLSSENTASRISHLLENLPHAHERHFK